ncbi:hypothetical protein A3Q56_05871 [Intoshia linei]|uniref:Uncharacterized protein n=1 Tax=Intoshia linei TaxID=1819745 RepID=A0A177AY27_9BILA|nr:hypothetical protein A3Q56_05871 [Intoshia linei]
MNQSIIQKPPQLVDDSGRVTMDAKEWIILFDEYITFLDEDREKKFSSI